MAGRVPRMAAWRPIGRARQFSMPLAPCAMFFARSLNRSACQTLFFLSVLSDISHPPATSTTWQAESVCGAPHAPLGHAAGWRRPLARLRLSLLLLVLSSLILFFFFFFFVPFGSVRVLGAIGWHWGAADCLAGRRPPASWPRTPGAVRAARGNAASLVFRVFCNFWSSWLWWFYFSCFFHFARPLCGWDRRVHVIGCGRPLNRTPRDVMQPRATRHLRGPRSSPWRARDRRRDDRVVGVRGVRVCAGVPAGLTAGARSYVTC